MKNGITGCSFDSRSNVFILMVERLFFYPTTLPANPGRKSRAALCLIRTSSPVVRIGQLEQAFVDDGRESRFLSISWAGLCYAKYSSKNKFLSGNSVDMAQFK